MTKRKIGKLTEVKVDLASYSYLMNGVAGIGKTTTVTDICKKEFGVDGFILLTIGREPKPSHIGGIMAESISDWDDLEEVIDILCEDKKTEYPNLRMLVIDSVDEIFRLAEQKVIELHNKKVAKATDRIDTIKKAFGGFQAGENKVCSLITEVLFKVVDYGINLFFIGHTKQKNKTDLFTEIEYEQITSNLDNKYYNCIKDKVNIVMCAYMEREFTDIKTRKDVFTKTNKDIGQIKSEKRVVSFRDESYALDVKSHLKNICDKCELNADTIITELKEAMKKQNGMFGGEMTDKAIDEKVKKEREEQSNAQPKVNNIELKQNKLEEIKQNLSNINMEQLQDIMTKYKLSSFEDVSVIPMECLDDILKLL